MQVSSTPFSSPSLFLMFLIPTSNSLDKNKRVHTWNILLSACSFDSSKYAPLQITDVQNGQSWRKTRVQEYTPGSHMPTVHSLPFLLPASVTIYHLTQDATVHQHQFPPMRPPHLPSRLFNWKIKTSECWDPTRPMIGDNWYLLWDWVLWMKFWPYPWPWQSWVVGREHLTDISRSPC